MSFDAPALSVPKPGLRQDSLYSIPYIDFGPDMCTDLTGYSNDHSQDIFMDAGGWLELPYFFDLEMASAQTDGGFMQSIIEHDVSTLRELQPLVVPAEDIWNDGYARSPTGVGIHVLDVSNAINTASSLPLQDAPLRPARFQNHQSVRLQRWLENNLDNPYPDKGQKQILAQEAGLTVKQVAKWFARTRMRKLNRVPVPPVLAEDQILEPLFETALRLSDDEENSRSRSEPYPQSKKTPKCADQLQKIDDPQVNTSDRGSSLQVTIASPPRRSSPPPKTLNVAGAHIMGLKSRLSALTARESKPSLVGAWLADLPDGFDPVPPNQWAVYCSDFASEPMNDGSTSMEDLPLPTSATSLLEEAVDQLPSTESACISQSRPASSLKRRFDDADDKSEAGRSIASASSNGSCSSYASFGPRKGRRVNYLVETKGLSNVVDDEMTGIEEVLSQQSTDISDHEQQAGPDYDHESDSDQDSDPGVNTASGHSQVPLETASAIVPEILIDKNAFHCAFCPKTFKRRYAWNRHEESTHAPCRVWVCEPSIFTNADVFQESLLWNRPGVKECWQKPEHDRAFFRADHLQQHLHIKHNVERDEVCCKRYHEISIPESMHTCPCCGMTGNDWRWRCDHVARHFLRGHPKVHEIEALPIAMFRDKK